MRITKCVITFFYFQCLNLSCKEKLQKQDYRQVVSEVFSASEKTEVTWAVEESWAKMCSNRKSDSISKTDFVKAIESQPIYILLFNIVSNTPPLLLKERLQRLIQ